MTGAMHSSFVAIATLVTSNLGERCLINILMNISSESLRYYFKCGKIYKGISSKKKIDLVEMVVYGCVADKIKIKTLPGYGNLGLKRKEILACTNNKPSVKVHDY